MTHPEHAAGACRDEAHKHAYAAPKITVYGKVADLTAGALSTTNDPGGATNGGKP